MMGTLIYGRKRGGREGWGRDILAREEGPSSPFLFRLIRNCHHTTDNETREEGGGKGGGGGGGMLFAGGIRQLFGVALFF